MKVTGSYQDQRPKSYHPRFQVFEISRQQILKVHKQILSCSEPLRITIEGLIRLDKLLQMLI